MSLDTNKKWNKNIEKKEFPRAKLNTKELLNDLAQKISKEYGVDISEVKKLINSKTETKLETLKWLVSTSKDVIDIDALQNVIRGAKDVIEKASKDEIQILKSSVEQNDVQEKQQEDFFITSRIISKELYKKAQSPQWITDNIIGAGIGLVNSLESTIQLLYNIGAGAIKTPYHIYLIASWKGEYKNMKRV